MSTVKDRIEKKVEACETYQNCEGICCKCGWEESAHTPHSERQARAQLASIIEMVANLTEEGAAKEYILEMDRDQCLEAIAIHDEDEAEEFRGIEQKESSLESMRERLAELIETSFIQPDDLPGFEWDEDEARQTIQDDALEVQVRGDWHTPGDEDASKPSEFYILLCTGGPAVRLIGELDRCGQPDSVRIEHQGWFKPWTELVNISSDEREALLAYCQQFYFGE